jgi:predicted DNA binding CopG/RHH family protein
VKTDKWVKEISPSEGPHAGVPQAMHLIANWEDVPIFDSEEAEAGFWAENKPDVRLMDAAVAGNSEAAESVTITLRIDPRMLARIKRLARSRFLNYQSMIKQWLSERMEHEFRMKND